MIQSNCTTKFIVGSRRDKRSVYWTPTGWTTELSKATRYSEASALHRMSQMRRNKEKAFIDSPESLSASAGYSNESNFLTN